MNESILGGMAAFFPWITIAEPFNLGTRLRLFPKMAQERRAFQVHFSVQS
jgi:hypothetical protein